MNLKTIGYYILIISLAFLIGTGIYKLFEELIFQSGLPLIYRLSITGLITGLLIILIGLIIERIKEGD